MLVLNITSTSFHYLFKSIVCFIKLKIIKRVPYIYTHTWTYILIVIASANDIQYIKLFNNRTIEHTSISFKRTFSFSFFPVRPLSLTSVMERIWRKVDMRWTHIHRNWIICSNNRTSCSFFYEIRIWVIVSH